MSVEEEIQANKRRADAGRAALVASVALGGADLGEDIETIAIDTVANILHYLDVRSGGADDLLARAIQTYLRSQEEA